MAKSVKKSVTLNHLAQMVERGFLSVRAELSKKSDKADIEGLRVELKNDINQLSKATKIGFDEVDNSFREVEVKLEGVNHRLSNLDNRLDDFVNHEKRLLKVEHELNLSP